MGEDFNFSRLGMCRILYMSLESEVRQKSGCWLAAELKLTVTSVTVPELGMIPSTVLWAWPID